MIVDSSAIVAIIRGESGAPACANALAASTSPRISAGTWLETSIVIQRLRTPSLSRQLDQFIHEWRIAIEPFTAEQARMARDAYRDFGKGSGNPAQLNFGDCFAYALAIDKREPLLFTGDDFRHTDVEPAITRT